MKTKRLQSEDLYTECFPTNRIAGWQIHGHKGSWKQFKRRDKNLFFLRAFSPSFFSFIFFFLYFFAALAIILLPKKMVSLSIVLCFGLSYRMRGDFGRLLVLPFAFLIN
jgi:hypothetical protein